MTTLSPIHLRRMFNNVRSEGLLRSIFGQKFRTFIALRAKFYKGELSREQMIALENRWLRMHSKQLQDAENENAPSVFMA